MKKIKATFDNVKRNDNREFNSGERELTIWETKFDALKFNGSIITALNKLSL